MRKSLSLITILAMGLVIILVGSVAADNADTQIPPPPDNSTGNVVTGSSPSMPDGELVQPPNQVVIHFEEGTSQAARDAYIASIGGVVTETIAVLDVVAVTLPNYMSASSLGSSPIVELSEPDYLMTVHVDVPPNDPLYDQQWAPPFLNLDTIWPTLNDGAMQEVVVAVIDTGVCFEHEDLVGLYTDGWDFVDDDDHPDDLFGHGCPVSSVIAAHTNNGIGIAGVAPNAKIMPVRVLGPSGSGKTSDVAAGIVWAADHGADIINLSLGSAFPAAVTEDAVKHALAKGVVIIASAGNSAAPSPGYPAGYDGVISVGSLDSDGSPSSFSNRGALTWAPGRDILMANLDNTYKQMNGTSFSGPYVAGMAALVLGLGHEFEIIEEGEHFKWKCDWNETCPVP